MALIPMWKCDRDGTLFDDKKAAEEYDKMLELAGNISCWIEQEVEGLSDESLEAIGMLIAQNKDKMQKAMKGKPEVLLEKPEEAGDSAENVTSIAS